MNDEQAPDERLRTRLLAAAEVAYGDAAGDARGRQNAHLAARMRARAPVLAARRRGLRYLSMAAVAAAGIAAAVSLQQWHHAAPTAQCSLPTGSLEIARVAGAQRLDLAGHGDVIGSQDTRFSVLAADACELRVRVTSGALALDVHALAPGRIVLVTPHGDVIVRGTQFSVEVGDTLAVHLLSGVLDVADGAQHRALQAGESLTQSRSTPGVVHTRAVTEAERASVRDLLARRRSFTAPRIAAAPAEAVQAAPGIQQLPEVVFELPPVQGGGAGDFLHAAEEARQRGDNPSARRLYERASHGRLPDVEVALLRWARFELADGRTDAALGLLARHRSRFPHGALGAEAGWLEVSVYRARGDSSAAQKAAARLAQAFPNTPQAAAARKLVTPP